MNDLSMYQESILDHYRNPRNQGTIKHAQHHAHATNPLCGDEVDFYFNYDAEGKVSEVKFTGRGCTIAVASASMLSEKLQGLTKEEIEKLSTDDVTKLLGVVVNPARMKCATLGLETVQKAIGHHA